MGFLNSLSLTSSVPSSQVYSRLPESNESEYPAARPVVRRTFRSSRHRFLVLFIVLCSLSLLLFPIFQFTQLPDLKKLKVLHKWQKELDIENIRNITKIEPILGAEATHLQLYFPPVGDEFRPHVAPYNHPPEERPRTPLFIPFTRNNMMLQQAVLGYIAAGWPREDIVIVDNSGTLDANSEGMLSPDNPFFVNYPLYRSRYGVSILQTSTLLNFAQLQNFLLRISISQGWPYFFWSHMDVGILADEVAVPYKTFYERVLDVLNEATVPHPNSNITWSLNKNETRPTHGNWAIKFFEFDNLSLVNVAAWRTIGQWDVFIPYYNTDCDAYARVLFHGYTKDNVKAGYIFDLAEQVEHLEARLFPATQALLNTSEAVAQLAQYRAEVAAANNSNIAAGLEPAPDFGTATHLLNDPDQRPNSPRYQHLLVEFNELQNRKFASQRNTWQDAQKGGKGQPWTYDPRGFQKAWWETASYGRDLYTKKWSTLDCYLKDVKLEDEWASLYPELHPELYQEQTQTQPQAQPQDEAGEKARQQQEQAQRENELGLQKEQEKVKQDMERIKQFEKEIYEAEQEEDAAADDDNEELWSIARREEKVRRVRKRTVQRASSGE